MNDTKNSSNASLRSHAPDNMTGNTQFWLRESLFIVFLMLAVLSALALVSWQEGQGSVFQYGHHLDENLQKHNLIGNVGGQFAGLLFSLLGNAALVIPFILLGIGAQLLRSKTLSYQPINLMLKLVSILIFLPSLSCLLGWHFSSEASVTAGGFISMALADHWASEWPVVVSTLVAFILCLFSGAFVFGFSWLSVCAWLGEQLIDLVFHTEEKHSNTEQNVSQKSEKSEAKAAKKLLKHQKKMAAADEKARKKALKQQKIDDKKKAAYEASERQYELALDDVLFDQALDDNIDEQADAFFSEDVSESSGLDQDNASGVVSDDLPPMFIDTDMNTVRDTETNIEPEHKISEPEAQTEARAETFEEVLALPVQASVPEIESSQMPVTEIEQVIELENITAEPETGNGSALVKTPDAAKGSESQVIENAMELSDKMTQKNESVLPKAFVPENEGLENADKSIEPLDVEPQTSIKIEPLKSEASIRPQELDIPDNAPAQPASDYKDLPLPTLDILGDPPVNEKAGFTDEELVHMSDMLVAKLAEFGVKAVVEAVCPGPVITRFEIQPAPGVKVSKITNLAKDIARSMAMVSIRVVEVIPGKSVVGIEIPNNNRAIVSFKKLLSSNAFKEHKSPVALGLGDDIAGEAVIADLAKMPHLLVAGTTGSGKSVGVNAMIISMLYKATPKELRLILIDPKMLELSIYEGIPHLLTPVITDMNDAANGLRWSVAEMERRYKLMSKMGVRNLAGFNAKIQAAIDAGEPIDDPLWDPEQQLDNTTIPTLEPLPFVVIVIDEFADMMMIVGKKVEELIARIAQKARAAGIHLILATQRPSVDVITGLIKANVPTRISFQVSSKIDSRTIIDQGGAEQLLGHGDMLYMPPGSSIPVRVHGAFVTDEDVHSVVECWKAKGEPEYISAVTEADYDDSGMLSGLVETDPNDESDVLFDEAIAFVTSAGKVSISSVQRKFRIGYNRAARLVESMETAGVVSAPEHNGQRKVLANPPPADY